MWWNIQGLISLGRKEAQSPIQNSLQLEGCQKDGFPKPTASCTMWISASRVSSFNFSCIRRWKGRRHVIPDISLWKPLIYRATVKEYSSLAWNWLFPYSLFHGSSIKRPQNIVLTWTHSLYENSSSINICNLCIFCKITLIKFTFKRVHIITQSILTIIFQFGKWQESKILDLILDSRYVVKMSSGY